MERALHRARIMPSLDHESLLELFRARPTLAPELLGRVPVFRTEAATARFPWLHGATSAAC